MPAPGLPVNVSPYGGMVAVQFTRAANTTAYAANDQLGATMQLTNFFEKAGGTATITSVDLLGFISAVPTGQNLMRLVLYNAAPSSTFVDNDPWNLPSGDRAAFIGEIDLAQMVSAGATCRSMNNAPLCGPLVIQAAAGSRDLWVRLITAHSGGTWSPAANSEVYEVRIRRLLSL